MTTKTTVVPLKIGSKEIGLEFSAPRDPRLALALAEDTPFPKGTTELGKIAAETEAALDFTFGRGSATVKFKASGFSGLGVYQDPAAMVAALAPGDELAQGLSLRKRRGSHYLALSWGYDLSTSNSAAIALNAALRATFGLDASRDGRFAVIRLLPTDLGARTSLARTLASWTMPRQIDAAGEMAPGSWLVSEVNGEFAGRLGVAYGIDFNWIRQAELQGLSGDIGLKLQASAAATLGFNVSGRYAVVLGRESLDASDETVRLRLYKLAKKGWSFALNANLAATPDTDAFLPGQFDEFVAAMFGVHSAQAMRDLQLLRKWTDPSQSLPDLLAGAGSKYAQRLLEQVTGVDPRTAFADARQRLLDVLDAWDRLDSRLASKVAELVRGKRELDQVRSLATTIADADQQSLQALLGERLGDVAFFRSPAGQWLEAAIGKSLLAALTSSTEFKRLKRAAADTVALLDGSTIETTFDRLQSWIDSKLRLDQLQEVSDRASFDEVDAWLRGKLSEFLGETFDFSKLDEVRKTIDLILTRGETFYSRARQALNSTYQVKFAANYQKNTAADALLDMSFDLAVDGAGKALRAAVGGDFRRLLTQAIPGVTLNVGTLSHGVERKADIEVTLPFFKGKTNKLNNSLAKLQVTEDSGRVLAYELSANDDVAVARAKYRRDSNLMVGAAPKLKLGQVRTWSTGDISYAYSFALAYPNATVADLETQLMPYATEYFADNLAARGDGTASGSFKSWLLDVDRTANAVENLGAGHIGNVLGGMQVSVPASLANAWFKAPGRKRDPIYREMSLRLQQRLKQLMMVTSFADPKAYRDNPPTSALLVYAAIPPANELKRLASGGLSEPANGDIYWDWPDPKLRKAMVLGSRTAVNLTRLLVGAHDRLQQQPALAGRAGRFAPTEGNVRRILGDMFETQISDDILQGLLLVEKSLVKGARDAGLAMAKFTGQSSTDPEAALKALTDFGADVTSTFNKKVRGRFGGAAIRPLGSLLFIEAAAVLAGKSAKPVAVADVAVVKSGVAFPPAGFPQHDRPSQDDVKFEQRIVNT